MIRFCLILVLISIICSCAVTKDNIQVTPQKDYNSLSLYYYSLAENAIHLGDYELAIDLFKKADFSYPENIYIKERLLKFLASQLYHNPEYHDEIIRLGEDYYSRNLYSASILITLAESYNALNNYEMADKYLRLALDLKPSMRLYTSYFIFKKKNLSIVDTTLLNKALEFPWKEQENIILLAELYKDINQNRSISILEQAYSQWDNERVLRLLLSAYDTAGEDKKVIETIQQRIDEQQLTSDNIKTHLIGRYFKNKNYERIVKNSDLCFNVKNEQILRYLFFSALSLEEYNLAIKAGYAVENTGALPEEIKSYFYAYFGYMLFCVKEDEKAAQYFIKSSDINVLLKIFSDYGLITETNENRLKDFTALILTHSTDMDFTNFLAGYIYTILEEKTLAEEYLDKVSIDFLKNNDLMISTVIAYLTNSRNINKSRELLAQRDEQIPSENEIFGFYFYNINSDTLAYDFFKKEIKNNPQPEIGVFMITSILGEKFNDIDNLIPILEKGVALYPDNPEILNILGYTIADHNIENKYDEAEILLKNALEIDPENIMIWDSLAWLYFKKGMTKEALEAMKKPLEQKIEHSEIAYHIGEIYLKLNKTKKATKYFQLAVELDSEQYSVEISKKNLEKIK